MAQNILHTFHGNVPFVAALIERQARFLVVGGLAVKFYWPERVVDDLDLLIEPTISNAERVLQALSMFHPGHGLNPDQLGSVGKHLPLKQYLYVDVITPKADGPAFESLWDSSVEARLGPLHIRVPSRVALLAWKRKASETDESEVGRKKHSRDAEALAKAHSSCALRIGVGSRSRR